MTASNKGTESRLRRIIREKSDSQWLSAIGFILLVASCIFLMFVLFLMDG